jgi:hypothetical protein
MATNLNVINNVFGRCGGPTVTEEMSNHFRLAAFTDSQMAWQGVTIYPTTKNGAINGWVAQLDDGRRYVNASLVAVAETAGENAACWANKKPRN